jgi:hypothetical protein
MCTFKDDLFTYAQDKTNISEILCLHFDEIPMRRTKKQNK